MNGTSKSKTAVSLYLIAACLVWLLFSLNWNHFIQPSGIVYWSADVEPPSYEAISLQCLSDKGIVYLSISAVLLLSLLGILFKRIHRIDSIQSDLLLLWGMATITPLVLWSLGQFFFRRQLPSPEAVRMLIPYNDQFLFLTLLLPVIAVQYITGIAFRNKMLGRLAVFFALLCIPIIVSVNFFLDENNIRQADHIGRMLATAFRYVPPVMLAVFSWSALKTVPKRDNTSGAPADHLDNPIRKNTYLMGLGIIWFIWGCFHLMIHYARIQAIVNAYEFIDGPLVDGTFELLNTCLFCIAAFILFRKSKKRGPASIRSRHTMSLWIMGFFAAMIHEEVVSVFIRSIAYDSFHVYFVYLTGASFVAVLPLLVYGSCLTLQTPLRIIVALSSLAFSLCLFVIPCMIEQRYFHIAANGFSLFLPPFTLIVYSIIAGINGKRQGIIRKS